MIINGRKLAKEMEESLARRIKKSQASLILAMVQVGENAVSENFIRMKREFAERVGIGILIKRISLEPEASVFERTCAAVHECGEIADGLIVQLPLPPSCDTAQVLSKVSPEKDVDALSPQPVVLSPIVEAIRHIFDTQHIVLKNKRVLIIGRGRLVGAPIAEWLSGNGTTVDVIGDEVEDVGAYTRSADIIISGAGSPHLIKPSMIPDGVVLIDCGASEAGGKVLGDADPACAEKCSVFSPVPGGVGPLTVAELFENLWKLSSLAKR